MFKVTVSITSAAELELGATMTDGSTAQPVRVDILSPAAVRSSRAERLLDAPQAGPRPLREWLVLPKLLDHRERQEEPHESAFLQGLIRHKVNRFVEERCIRLPTQDRR